MALLEAAKWFPLCSSFFQCLRRLSEECPIKRRALWHFCSLPQRAFGVKCWRRGRRVGGKHVSSELQREVNAASKQMKGKQLGTKKGAWKL